MIELASFTSAKTRKELLSLVRIFFVVPTIEVTAICGFSALLIALVAQLAGLNGIEAAKEFLFQIAVPIAKILFPLYYVGLVAHLILFGFGIELGMLWFPTTYIKLHAARIARVHPITEGNQLLIDEPCLIAAVPLFRPLTAPDRRNRISSRTGSALAGFTPRLE